MSSVTERLADIERRFNSNEAKYVFGVLSLSEDDVRFLIEQAKRGVRALNGGTP